MASNKLLFLDHEITTAKTVPKLTPLLINSTEELSLFANAEILKEMSSSKVKTVFCMSVKLLVIVNYF